MLRFSGGSVLARDDTRRSPTRISPSDGSRNPAISRKVVVLPQPDGPSRQTSLPWSILSETSSTTASDPNRLVRPRNSTDATQLPPRTGVPFCAAHLCAVLGLLLIAGSIYAPTTARAKAFKSSAASCRTTGARPAIQGRGVAS